MQQCNVKRQKMGFLNCIWLKIVTKRALGKYSNKQKETQVSSFHLDITTNLISSSVTGAYREHDIILLEPPGDNISFFGNHDGRLVRSIEVVSTYLSLANWEWYHTAESRLTRRRQGYNETNCTNSYGEQLSEIVHDGVLLKSSRLV